MRERCCYGAEIPSSRQLGHVDSAPHRTNTGCFVYLSPDCFFFFFPAAFQAVQELLESLELEKSSYHMGLSKVSTVRQPSRRSVGSRDSLLARVNCSTTAYRAGAALSSGQRFRLLENPKKNQQLM